jgi:hypothetical protein
METLASTTHAWCSALRTRPDPAAAARAAKAEADLQVTQVGAGVFVCHRGGYRCWELFDAGFQLTLQSAT